MVNSRLRHHVFRLLPSTLSAYRTCIDAASFIRSSSSSTTAAGLPINGQPLAGLTVAQRNDILAAAETLIDGKVSARIARWISFNWSSLQRPILTIVIHQPAVAILLIPPTVESQQAIARVLTAVHVATTTNAPTRLKKTTSSSSSGATQTLSDAIPTPSPTTLSSETSSNEGSVEPEADDTKVSLTPRGSSRRAPTPLHERDRPPPPPLVVAPAADWRHRLIHRWWPALRFRLTDMEMIISTPTARFILRHRGVTIQNKPLPEPTIG
jgi:hypothetical protein